MGERTVTRIRCVTAIISLLLLSAECYAQSTAVPFLIIPTSVEGNGMGGIAASMVTEDAISNISNPAQLGVFSLENSFSASTYAPKTDWLPSFGGGLSLDARAVSAGLRLDRYMKLPAPISVGIGYSTVYFNLGTFNTFTPNNPSAVSTYNAFERADMLTFGVGINYIVRLGLGYTYKWIDSELAPFGPGQQIGSGAAKAPAHDFGALLQVPVIDIVSRIQQRPLEFGNGVSPLFNLTFGWAERNIGGDLYYPFQQQSDPLPRQGVLGWNFEIGLQTEVNHQPLKIVSFTWAREAENILVSVQTTATPQPSGDTLYSNQFSYKDGLGSMRPYDNLFLGKITGGMTVQKGWQIDIAQCLYFREGSDSPFGGFPYQTHGESFHLNGFLKLLAWIGVWHPWHGWGAFVLKHIDLQYSTSEYTSQSNIISGTKFSSINIVFR